MKSSNHCLENRGNSGIRKSSRLMIVRSLVKKIDTNERWDRLAKENKDLQRAYKIQSLKMNQIMKENEALQSQVNGFKINYVHINQPQSNLEKRIDIDVNKCKYCDIIVNDMEKHVEKAHTQRITSMADCAQTEKIINLKRKSGSESGPKICNICDTELRNEFELHKHMNEYHTCR